MNEKSKEERKYQKEEGRKRVMKEYSKKEDTDKGVEEEKRGWRFLRDRREIKGR